MRQFLSRPLFLLSLALVLAMALNGHANPPAPGWTLTFEDEFLGVNPDGTGLDRSKWTPGLGTLRSNGEQEWYVDSPNNIAISNGTLKLNAIHDHPPGGVGQGPGLCGDGITRPDCDYSSGEVITKSSFYQRFGYFEIRCKMPAGKGQWPAFWLLPADPGGWPPEYDIFENLGDKTKTLYFSSHVSPLYPYVGGGVRKEVGQYVTSGTVNYSAGFHTIGFLWKPGRISWYLDDVPQGTLRRYVHYMSPMYLLANLAVGGSWPGYPDGSYPFPTTLEIDYIRAWELPQPSPWQTADIGSPGLAGRASWCDGVFDVTGEGNDIWGCSDQFRYVYRPLNGDGAITARVASLKNGTTTGGAQNPWVKAGIMIRETLDANAKTAMVGVTPGGNGSFFQSRAATNGATAAVVPWNAQTPYYWVKLVRNGSVLTGSTSPDGSAWTPIGTATIAMGASVYAGLAVTSHNPGTLADAQFDQVAVSSAAPVLTSIAVSPTGTTIAAGGSRLFTATGYDQFGGALSPQPAIDWDVTGGGAIDDNGVFSACAVAGGPYMVTAANGSVQGAATLSVLAPPAGGSLVLFDDTLRNGCTFTGVAAQAGTPVHSGTAAYGGTASAYAQFGLSCHGLVVPADKTAVQFWFYISGTATGIGGFMVQQGSGSYPTASFSSSTGVWTVDGFSGTTTKGKPDAITPNTWHLATLNLAATFAAAGKTFTPGVTKLNTVVAQVTNAAETIYMDDVSLVPELSAPVVAKPDALYPARVSTLPAPGPVLPPRSLLPPPGVAGMGGICLFDDLPQNGCTYSGSIAALTSPVHSGTAAYGATAGGSPQLGLSLNKLVVPAGQTTLKMYVYVKSPATGVLSFMVALGPPTYQSFTFNNSSTAYWTVDGAPGSVNMTANTWHEVKLNLAGAFGASLVPGTTKLGSVLTQFTSGSESVYMDDVFLVPPDGFTPVLASITLAPAAVALPPGSTRQFVAIGKDQGSTTLALPSVAWSASGGGTIDGTGLFATGTNAGGPYTVTASSLGQTGTASVTVVGGGGAPILTTIAVAPAGASVQAGANQTFTAVAKDQYGALLSPQPAFTWSVNGGGAFTGSGLFTAGGTAGGPYTVIAASGGISGTAGVTVTGGGGAPPVLTSITVSPASASLLTGTTKAFVATAIDQDGASMSPQPVFAWSVTGGGTINGSGLFTSGAAAGGPHTVTAASAGIGGTAPWSSPRSRTKPAPPPSP